MIDGLGEAMYITWCGLGIIIDKIDETFDDLIIYISVPKNTTIASDLYGDKLAKRLKETLTEMGVKRLTVKYKIRDEVWNTEKRAAAEIEARKKLFGSQW
ncbi:MAG: hypothetical protein ACI4DK_07255 [Lachnospiraceae bacterium]